MFFPYMDNSSIPALDLHLKKRRIISSRLFNTTARTCAFELASPHAFSRGSTLGAVRGLTAGLGAVAGQEDLSLVDPTVMFRRTANRAADTGPLWAVCAPLTLQSRLGKFNEGQILV